MKDTKFRKRPFVVDYQISGSLHLSVRDQSIARDRAERLIKAALADLEECSATVEHDIAEPIDAEQRYLAAKT